MTEQEYYDGTIDPENGADWNQTAPVDETPAVDDFRKTVSDYLAWEISSLLKSGGEEEQPCKQNLSPVEKPQTIRWKTFRLTDVFEVKNTKSILSSDIVKNSGTTPYLCAGADNNGVTSYIQYDNSFLEKGGCIFIGGKTFVVSYQEKDFFSNDSHNLALYIKGGRRSKSVHLYMAACICKSLLHKYSWGNSISKAKIQSDTILLPVKLDGSIDFDFMESFVKELETEQLAKLTAYLDLMQKS